MVREILVGALLIITTIDIAWFVNIYFERFQRAIVVVFDALDEHYLCGYRIGDLLLNNFFERFRHFNDEGFCYTFSAVIMLSLKHLRSAQLVRGNIRCNNYGYHSWVEIRYFGVWYVIDVCLHDNTRLLVPRTLYYSVQRPQVMVRYRHRQFWADPAAHQLYTRLQKLETSRVFVEIWDHYTPAHGHIEIFDMITPLHGLPEADYYSLFPPDFSFRFSQRIVDEFMARPERLRPKMHTLRRLESFYKHKRRAAASE